MTEAANVNGLLHEPITLHRVEGSKRLHVEEKCNGAGGTSAQQEEHPLLDLASKALCKECGTSLKTAAEAWKDVQGVDLAPTILEVHRIEEDRGLRLVRDVLAPYPTWTVRSGNATHGVVLCPSRVAAWASRYAGTTACEGVDTLRYRHQGDGDAAVCEKAAKLWSLGLETRSKLKYFQYAVPAARALVGVEAETAEIALRIWSDAVADDQGMGIDEAVHLAAMLKR